MKGVLPWLVHWACRGGARDYLTFCPALAALVSSVQNNFFLTIHYVPVSPWFSKLGRQPSWVRLSLGMCHWYLPCQLQDRLCVTKVLSATTPLPPMEFWTACVYFHHMYLYPLDGGLPNLSNFLGALALYFLISVVTTLEQSK
jgi:hypothetical protein